MLWKRVVTAVVLLPILIASIMVSKDQPFAWPFMLLCAAVTAMCSLEMLRMFFGEMRDLMGGTALAAFAFFSGALLPAAFSFPAIMLFVVLAVFHSMPGGDDVNGKTRKAALLVLCVVYIGGFFSLYPRTLSLPRGEYWVLLGIATVAAGDTFAYFAGRVFGRRKLAPSISPNKTVEGALGGLAGSVAACVVCAYYFLPGVPAWYAALSGGAIGICGQGGDLFESLLKRSSGVKDSGALLPGHGGVFDRTDAILAASPSIHLLAAVATLTGKWT
ncbi:MAG: phosphatidate cytidylyltransferase [Syntrophorhabdaceae bacterium]|nr:phosphatidate cytidylyltransferase [Syntrophorhabdaceae bacterium]